MIPPSRMATLRRAASSTSSSALLRSTDSAATVTVARRATMTRATPVALSSRHNSSGYNRPLTPATHPADRNDHERASPFSGAPKGVPSSFDDLFGSDMASFERMIASSGVGHSTSHSSQSSGTSKPAQATAPSTSSMASSPPPQQRGGLAPILRPRDSPHKAVSFSRSFSPTQANTEAARTQERKQRHAQSQQQQQQQTASGVFSFEVHKAAAAARSAEMAAAQRQRLARHAAFVHFARAQPPYTRPAHADAEAILRRHDAAFGHRENDTVSQRAPGTVSRRVYTTPLRDAARPYAKDITTAVIKATTDELAARKQERTSASTGTPSAEHAIRGGGLSNSASAPGSRATSTGGMEPDDDASLLLASVLRASTTSNDSGIGRNTASNSGSITPPLSIDCGFLPAGFVRSGAAVAGDIVLSTALRLVQRQTLHVLRKRLFVGERLDPTRLAEAVRDTLVHAAHADFEIELQGTAQDAETLEAHAGGMSRGDAAGGPSGAAPAHAGVAAASLSDYMRNVVTVVEPRVRRLFAQLLEPYAALVTPGAPTSPPTSATLFALPGWADDLRVAAATDAGNWPLLARRTLYQLCQTVDRAASSTTTSTGADDADSAAGADGSGTSQAVLAARLKLRVARRKKMLAARQQASGSAPRVDGVGSDADPSRSRDVSAASLTQAECSGLEQDAAVALENDDSLLYEPCLATLEALLVSRLTHQLHGRIMRMLLEAACLDVPGEVPDSCVPPRSIENLQKPLPSLFDLYFNNGETSATRTNPSVVAPPLPVLRMELELQERVMHAVTAFHAKVAPAVLDELVVGVYVIEAATLALHRLWIAQSDPPPYPTEIVASSASKKPAEVVGPAPVESALNRSAETVGPPPGADAAAVVADLIDGAAARVATPAVTDTRVVSVGDEAAQRIQRHRRMRYCLEWVICASPPSAPRSTNDAQASSGALPAQRAEDMSLFARLSFGPRLVDLSSLKHSHPSENSTAAKPETPLRVVASISTLTKWMFLVTEECALLRLAPRTVAGGYRTLPAAALESCEAFEAFADSTSGTSQALLLPPVSAAAAFVHRHPLHARPTSAEMASSGESPTASGVVGFASECVDFLGRVLPVSYAAVVPVIHDVFSFGVASEDPVYSSFENAVLVASKQPPLAASIAPFSVPTPSSPTHGGSGAAPQRDLIGRTFVQRVVYVQGLYEVAVVGLGMTRYEFAREGHPTLILSHLVAHYAVDPYLTLSDLVARFALPVLRALVAPTHFGQLFMATDATVSDFALTMRGGNTNASSGLISGQTAVPRALMAATAPPAYVSDVRTRINDPIQAELAAWPGSSDLAQAALDAATRRAVAALACYKLATRDAHTRGNHETDNASGAVNALNGATPLSCVSFETLTSVDLVAVAVLRLGHRQPLRQALTAAAVSGLLAMNVWRSSISTPVLDLFAGFGADVLTSVVRAGGSFAPWAQALPPLAIRGADALLQMQLRRPRVPGAAPLRLAASSDANAEAGVNSEASAEGATVDAVQTTRELALPTHDSVAGYQAHRSARLRYLTSVSAHDMNDSQHTIMGTRRIVQFGDVRSGGATAAATASEVELQMALPPGGVNLEADGVAFHSRKQINIALGEMVGTHLHKRKGLVMEATADVFRLTNFPISANAVCFVRTTRHSAGRGDLQHLLVLAAASAGAETTAAGGGSHLNNATSSPPGATLPQRRDGDNAVAFATVDKWLRMSARTKYTERLHTDRAGLKSADQLVRLRLPGVGTDAAGIDAFDRATMDPASGDPPMLFDSLDAHDVNRVAYNKSLSIGSASAAAVAPGSRAALKAIVELDGASTVADASGAKPPAPDSVAIGHQNNGADRGDDVLSCLLPLPVNGSTRRATPKEAPVDRAAAPLSLSTAGAAVSIMSALEAARATHLGGPDASAARSIAFDPTVFAQLQAAVQGPRNACGAPSDDIDALDRIGNVLERNALSRSVVPDEWVLSWVDPNAAATVALDRRFAAAHRTATAATGAGGVQYPNNPPSPMRDVPLSAVTVFPSRLLRRIIQACDVAAATDLNRRQLILTAVYKEMIQEVTALAGLWGVTSTFRALSLAARDELRAAGQGANKNTRKAVALAPYKIISKTPLHRRYVRFAPERSYARYLFMPSQAVRAMWPLQPDVESLKHVHRHIPGAILDVLCFARFLYVWLLKIGTRTASPLLVSELDLGASFSRKIATAPAHNAGAASTSSATTSTTTDAQALHLFTALFPGATTLNSFSATRLRGCTSGWFEPGAHEGDGIAPAGAAVGAARATCGPPSSLQFHASWAPRRAVVDGRHGDARNGGDRRAKGVTLSTALLAWVKTLFRSGSRALGADSAALFPVNLILSRLTPAQVSQARRQFWAPLIPVLEWEKTQQDALCAAGTACDVNNKLSDVADAAATRNQRGLLGVPSVAADGSSANQTGDLASLVGLLGGTSDAARVGHAARRRLTLIHSKSREMNRRAAQRKAMLRGARKGRESAAQRLQSSLNDGTARIDAEVAAQSPLLAAALAHACPSTQPQYRRVWRQLPESFAGLAPTSGSVPVPMSPSDITRPICQSAAPNNLSPPSENIKAAPIADQHQRRQELRSTNGRWAAVATDVAAVVELDDLATTLGWTALYGAAVAPEMLRRTLCMAAQHGEAHGMFNRWNKLTIAVFAFRMASSNLDPGSVVRSDVREVKDDGTRGAREDLSSPSDALAKEFALQHSFDAALRKLTAADVTHNRPLQRQMASHAAVAHRDRALSWTRGVAQRIGRGLAHFHHNPLLHVPAFKDSPAIETDGFMDVSLRAAQYQTACAARRRQLSLDGMTEAAKSPLIHRDETSHHDLPVRPGDVRGAAGRLLLRALLGVTTEPLPRTSAAAGTVAANLEAPASFDEGWVAAALSALQAPVAPGRAPSGSARTPTVNPLLDLDPINAADLQFRAVVRTGACTVEAIEYLRAPLMTADAVIGGSAIDGMPTGQASTASEEEEATRTSSLQPQSLESVARFAVHLGGGLHVILVDPKDHILSQNLAP